MSDLLVRVVKIDSVANHPQADRLEIVKVGGWQIVSGKGNYAVGQTAVHVPPDAMVPKELADAWGVTQYLSWRNAATKGRVKAVKLRGAPSYGFLAPNDTNAEVGTNIAEILGIDKYEEPESGTQGQMARNHPLFHTYTDIQNLRNYTNQLAYGEPLVVTEKIHGTNSRVGWVRSVDLAYCGGPNDQVKYYLEKVVGSHHTQRKTEDPGVYGLPFELYGEAIEKIRDMIMIDLHEVVNSIIFFGEIYGPGVQDLAYGTSIKAWRLFDIAVNGTYLPWTYIEDVSKFFNLPLVPRLTPGIFTFEQLCELAEGSSILQPEQVKEGIVVRPMREMTWGKGTLDPNPKRMIFKLIGSGYLTRKNGTEHH